VVVREDLTGSGQSAGSMIAATVDTSGDDPVAEPDVEPTLGWLDGSGVGLALGCADPWTVGTVAADSVYRPISAPATPTANAAKTPSATNRARPRRRGGDGGRGAVNV